jgi:acyl carrier protein
MADSLERQVIEIVAKRKKVPSETITRDSTFEQLGIDSLDGIDLVFTFEDTFRISVPDHVAREMRSIRQVVESLQAALAAQAAQQQTPTPQS